MELLLQTAQGYLERGRGDDDSAQPAAESPSVGSGAHCVGLLVTEESRPSVNAWLALHRYSPAQVEVVCVGSRSDLSSVARGLYSALRHFDETEVQIIVCESFAAQDAEAAGGIGEAIMNRLNKAAGGKVVRAPAAVASQAGATDVSAQPPHA